MTPSSGSTTLFGCPSAVHCPPKDEVAFGEVGANATTSYLHVPHGVGRDAAFRFVLNRVPVRQVVADFVGWKPVSGKAFTYHVRIEQGRSQRICALSKR